MNKPTSYILALAIFMIFLAFGTIWVITNIIAILKVVVPTAILAGVIGGMIMGWKLKAHFTPKGPFVRS